MTKHKRLKFLISIAVALLIALLVAFPHFQDDPIKDTIFSSSKSWGCGNTFVYKVNKDDTLGISVSASKEELGLTTKKQDFKIGQTDGLKVGLRIGSNLSRDYCNDLIGNSRFEELTASMGTATISISDVDETKLSENGNYTVTVVINDVHFTDINRESDIVIDKVIFEDVPVGWLPG